MSEEETDLYYDAFSVAPAASTDSPRNNPQSSHTEDIGRATVTDNGQQTHVEGDKELDDTRTNISDCKAGEISQNRLDTTQTVNTDSKKATSKSVLANIAKFEAVGKTTVPVRKSPVPTEVRKSPVPTVIGDAVKADRQNNISGLQSKDLIKELQTASKNLVTSREAESEHNTGRHRKDAWEVVSPDFPAIVRDKNKVTAVANEESGIHVVREQSASGGDWGEWETWDATYSTAPAKQQANMSANAVDRTAGLGVSEDSSTLYCLAKPFPDAAQDDLRHSEDGLIQVGARISVDSFGYSKTRKTEDDKTHQGHATTKSQTTNRDSEDGQPQVGARISVDSHGYSKTRKTEEDKTHQGHGAAKSQTLNKEEHSAAKNLVNDHENLDEFDETHAEFEQTIYDSVCNSADSVTRSEICDFEIVPNHQTREPGDKGTLPSNEKTSTSPGKSKKKFGEYTFSRKEAKVKSRALKRSTKDNPFVGHHEFKDPHKGAVPEVGENEGLMEALSPFNISDNSSNSSYFSDSSFDSPISDYSDDEGDKRIASTLSYSKKPLPPVPNKKKTDAGNEEDGMVLERVKLRRPRDAPSLPDAPDGLTPVQMKMRAVLQSLIENERNYISSLQRIVDEYKTTIINQFLTKNKEVKVTFDRIEDILNLHRMFEIELAAKLKNWYKEETIGLIFTKFSSQLVIDSYSGYVNNFESTCEAIREMENSRPAFKEFIKNKQMSSPDRLSLSSLMLKPIQRFPQLLMIIKDLLKYTQRDHHDREPLQEALTGIENVAHQLNERKRRTEQYYLGHQIISKLTPRVHMEKNSFLIRQDDMDQLSQDGSGGHTTKQRRLILMNDKIISIHVSQRDQDGSGVERFTYKWHQSLKELELTTSAITPNMHTRVLAEPKSTAIFSPKTDAALEEDPYSVASELTDMMHDVPILAQISQLISSLKLSYQGLTEDQIQEIVTNLQREIQGKDYQLQMLNSSSIILQDKVRRKKYVFSAANANLKQEWCTDFLMAKYALDIVNIPSWHQHDMKGTNLNQPCLLTKHMSVDMQRTFTRIKCGVRVYFPTRNEGSVEHLWVCSSTESLGQVSIVSLHTAKPSLVESFQATRCEIVCVEMVPGFALVKDDMAFAEDSIWMSTVDSEILVFMFNEVKGDSHRQAVHRFHPGCVVISMTYVDDRLFCGSRGGLVLVYSRDDDGIWSQFCQLQLGIGAVSSMICVGDSLWAACGSNICVIDVDSAKIQTKVETDPALHVQFLVKAGVGVWASFHGRPGIVLFHSESKKLLQELSVCNAINEFITVYTGDKTKDKNYEVTCLMVSLGLLWVGTNIGILLTYPLPRLRDGVPRINQRPQVALHSHNGPIRFLIPVHYGPVSAVPIRRRPSSILGRSNGNLDKVEVNKLPKLEERSTSVEMDHVYLSLDGEAMMKNADENIYDSVNYGHLEKQAGVSGLKDKGKTTKDKVSSGNKPDLTQSGEQIYYMQGPETNEIVPVETGSRVSEEHKYFILEPNTRQFIPVDTVPQSAGNFDSSQLAASKTSDKAVSKQGKTSEAADTASEAKNTEEKDVVYRRKQQDPESAESVDHLTDLRDNAPVVLRRQSGRPIGYQKNLLSQPLDTLEASGLPKQTPRPQSFRSELKNKLKMRKSLENITDLDVTTDGMGRLYGTLMRPTSLNVKTDSGLCSSLPSNYSLDASASEAVYVRPRTTTAISAKKPDITATRFGLKKKQDSVKDSVKEISPKASIKHRMSAPPSPTQKQTIGSSFSSGGTVDTLRKQNSNTILMLSGGDGYRDWKKRQSQQNYRPEEPCLIFWMYKF